MPRKPKAAPPDASLAPIPAEMLDQFVRQGPLTPEELDTAVRRFKKAIIERALGAELSHHLGYVAGGTKPEDTTNHRNGSSAKTVLPDDGPLARAAARCAARFAMRPSCGARPSTWRWRCCPTARVTSSGSGSSRPKARSSG